MVSQIRHDSYGDDAQYNGSEPQFEDQAGNSQWQHMDYYVRRVDNRPVLVQTMLRIDPSGEQEICTFYTDRDQLEEDWAKAVWEQAEGLEEGKSTDFVPPDEVILYPDDDEF